MDNVVLVTFDESSHAYQAMSELRRLSDEGAVSVTTAAIVERLADGDFRFPEDAENIGLTATAAGGVIGALIGALAGPLGLLLGGATGAIAGSVADVDEVERSEAMVGTLSQRVSPGTTALIADVDEPAPELLDAVMSNLGGRVARQPRLEVEAELESAEREARERRKAEGTQSLGDRVGALKDKVTGEA